MRSTYWDVLGWRNGNELYSYVLSAAFLTVTQIFITAVMRHFGKFSTDSEQLTPNSLIEFLLLLLLGISAGFIEEFVFRGYLQRQANLIIKNQTFAIIFQSVLFAMAHGFDQTPLGLSWKFFLGCIFGIVARRYRSILPGAISHCLINCFATVLLLPNLL